MDEATTLSDVLVLLDGIDSNESDSNSGASFDVETDLTFRQPLKLNTSKTRKDRRRRDGPVTYTTNLQRRKKAELQALRKEAQQLNVQLEKLQLSRLSHMGMLPALSLQSQHNSSSVWRSLAMVESEGRERSERTNRALKSILANQIKVNASIGKILGRSNLLEGVDFVFESQPTLDQPLTQLDFSDAILAELSSSLGQLRLEADKVLPSLAANLSITCNSENKSHKSGGSCVETTSTTPMACSMQKAAEILWHHITTKKNKDAQKSFRFIRSRSPDSLERNCIASLSDDNLLVNLDGVNIVRKYEEASRIVLVGTTTWFLPTGGLQFEDHHWTIISPSPTDPVHASVVRSCYQLQVKRVDTASVFLMDFAHVEKVVMESIGNKLRNVLQLQQNALLEKARPASSSGHIVV